MKRHRVAVVNAIGIYVGTATPDAALISRGDFVAVPNAAFPLRMIVDAAIDQLGQPADRLALSHPAWWDSLQVDRLLRDVRATGVTVDRYLTSGEAVVMWWRHAHGGDDNRRAGPFLVHEVGVDESGLSLVQSEGPRIETISSCEVSGTGRPEFVDMARGIIHSAGLALADVIAVLGVGTGDQSSYAELGRPTWCYGDDEHAEAFGTALAAAL